MSRAGPLLERETELARVQDASRRTAAGGGTVVAIQGPPGIGKTALVEAACRTGEAAGLAVMRASGAELERELAFGVVRQLFERPVRDLAPEERERLLEGAPRLALPTLLEHEPVTRAPEAGHAAMHGLYWLAAEFAARQPLLLVIDDAHWADAPSLRWVAYAARRLDGVPLLLLIAGRTAEPGADTALLEHVLEEAGADVLRLGPLSRTAVDGWLAHVYGAPPAPEFAEACWSSTGGNPLLLSQLTAELRAEGFAADADAAARLSGIGPAPIAHTVLRRLARLGKSAVAIAEAVAILSQDARLDRVAAVADVTLLEAAGVVDRLAAAEILAPGDPLAFAHPVLRSAVYEQLPPTRRGLAHAVAARRLLADGGGVERAASHLLQAPATGDPDVVEALRAAAASATARGAPDAAATLLRRALGEPPVDRAAVLLELAAAEAVAQDRGAANHAREAMAIASKPGQRARAALVAANSLLDVGRAEDAVAVLQTAEQDPELDDTTRREVAAAGLMMSSYATASHLDRRLSALRADELPGDSPAERILLALRAMDLLIRVRPREQPLALARRALAREDLARPSHEFVSGALARVLSLADHLDEARSTVSAFLEAGRTRGAATDVAFGCWLRSEMELRAGRLEQAEADAHEALELAREHGLWSVPAALAWLVPTLLERESPTAALELLADFEIDAEAPRPPSAAAGLLQARGDLFAARGDMAAAVADYRRCGRIQLGFGEINPTALPWRSRLALALDSLGQAAEARRLVDEELELARRFGAPRAIGIALRARALLARGDAVIRGLEEAVRTLADSPARLEHARAVTDLGAAMRRSGRRVEARDTLAKGLDAADRCGARQLAARARAELHAAGARPRRERVTGPEALTASERRVAELAAEGLTNRQIAQALFVTSKTVEMHLGHAYSKLGISGRGALATALGRKTGDSPPLPGPVEPPTVGRPPIPSQGGLSCARRSYSQSL